MIPPIAHSYPKEHHAVPDVSPAERIESLLEQLREAIDDERRRFAHDGPRVPEVTNSVANPYWFI